jgi:peroxiredoxin
MRAMTQKKSLKRFCAVCLYSLGLSAIACKEEPPPPPPKPASLSVKKTTPSLPEGDAVSGFDLPANDGSRFDARPWLGKKIIFLHFFATWSDTEDLVSLQNTLKNYPQAMLIAVSIDAAENRAKVDELVKSEKITVPVLLDPNGDFLQKQYNAGMTEAPKTLVINKNMKIVAKRTDESDEEISIKDLISALEK